MLRRSALSDFSLRYIMFSEFQRGEKMRAYPSIWNTEQKYRHHKMKSAGYDFDN
jgi:hypothetical protein